MPNNGSDNGGLPRFMRWFQPPTRESKPFTPTTEVWIILMQGLVLIGLLAVGGALAMAALLAWDLNVWAFKLAGLAGGLVVMLAVLTGRKEE